VFFFHCAANTVHQLNPQLLKPAVIQALNGLLAPIQAEFEASSEWKKITELAYPPEVKKGKEKKVKNKGTRFPGAAKADGAPQAAEAVEPSTAESTLPSRTK
jgi:tyrosyl-tRNA synthetase